MGRTVIAPDPGPAVLAYRRVVPGIEMLDGRSAGWLLRWVAAAHPDDLRELAARAAAGDRYDTHRAWYSFTRDQWTRHGHSYYDALTWMAAGIDTADQAAQLAMDHGLDPFTLRSRSSRPKAG